MGALALAVAAVLVTVLVNPARSDTNANGVISFGPPAVPKVLSLTMSGNGCPSMPSQSNRANWNEWVFSLGNFTAHDHESVAARDRNANCQIYISIASGPVGWQVAVKALTVRSSAFLSPGSSLSATGSAAAFLVSGSDDSVIPRATKTANFTNDRAEDVAGPVTVRFDFSDGGPWSDCMDDGADDNAVAGVINVNFRVAVRKTISEGRASFGLTATGDSSSKASVVEQLEWTWRRCTPRAPKTTRSATRTTAPSQTPNPYDEDLPPEQDDHDDHDEQHSYPTRVPEANPVSTGIVISMGPVGSATIRP